MVYEDDDGNLIYEPGVTYVRFVMVAPRPMSAEKWLARFSDQDLPADPIERERAIAGTRPAPAAQDPHASGHPSTPKK